VPPWTLIGQTTHSRLVLARPQPGGIDVDVEVEVEAVCSCRRHRADLDGTVTPKTARYVGSSS
jgi:hypothetical protein